MSTLHLISGNLRARPADLARLSAIIAADDSLLFLGPGIYSADVPLPTAVARFVLQTDLNATAYPVRDASVISYAELVGLVERHERSLNWT